METTWITKEEAAVLMGSIERPLSTRRVLELAKEGRIESGRTKDPNTNQTVVRIHAGSVERYLHLKANPEPLPAPREVREPRTPRTRQDDLAGLIRALRGEFGEYGLWLTLRQAAEYSGLPVAILEAFIRVGTLRALDVGRGRRGGRWRIRRVDLGEFQPLLLPPPPAKTDVMESTGQVL